MLRARVIVNPTAGRGDAVAVGALAADRLRAAGYEADVSPTTGPGHATALVAAAEGVARIVVVGGDGTLREAAEAAVAERARSIEIGFVPLGNANVVARELGIPLDPEGALELLDHGVPRPVDVGVVGDRVFLAMVGVGFDARVTRRMRSVRGTRVGGGLYRLWGDGVYGVVGAAALLVPFPRSLRVTVDGAPFVVDAASALVCNMETYAKGWAVTPGASFDDGRLDVCAASFRGPWRTTRWLLAQRKRRRLAGADVRYSAGANVRIESEVPFPWQADGDPMDDATLLEVRVRPAALRVIAPERVRGS